MFRWVLLRETHVIENFSQNTEVSALDRTFLTQLLIRVIILVNCFETLSIDLTCCCYVLLSASVTPAN